MNDNSPNRKLCSDLSKAMIDNLSALGNEQSTIKHAKLFLNDTVAIILEEALKSPAKTLDHDFLLTFLNHRQANETDEISLEESIANRLDDLRGIVYLAKSFGIKVGDEEAGGEEKATLPVDSQPEPLNVCRKKGIPDDQIRESIIRAKGNISDAARILNISYSSVSYRVQKREWEITKSPEGEVIVQKKTGVRPHKKYWSRRRRDDINQESISTALLKHKGNKSAVARSFKTSFSVIYRRMERLGIEYRNGQVESTRKAAESEEQEDEGAG